MTKKPELESPDRKKVLLEHTVSLVSSYVARNQIPVNDLPGLLKSTHAALEGIQSPGAQASLEKKPAVKVKDSVTDQYIICLEDGKKLTMLKRYLMTHFGMTPEEYRKKWDLPHDYPMVAPAYARSRSAFAKMIGLGRIPGGGKKKK